MAKYKFIFNPISKQLDLVNNDSDTPIVPTGTTTGIVIIDKVAVYSLLPSASSCTGNCYLVLNDQGTSWLPGSLGGTFYGKGVYYSNGFTWSLLGSVPYQATQPETDAGVIDTSFVTPLKLKNYSGFTQYQKVINLTTTGNTGSSTFLNNFLNIPTYTLSGLGGQAQLNGTGFVRITGTTVGYLTGTSSQFVKADGSLDSNTYLTNNQNITLTGVISGSGTNNIATTFTSGTTGVGKVVLATGATVSVLTVTDDILLSNPSFNNSYLGNKMINNSFTGLVSGGELSINTNNTLFNIESGTGQVIDYSNELNPVIKNISWSNLTGVTPTYILTSDISYILITTGGTILQLSTFPTPIQRRENIFLGRLNHIDRVNISFANTIPDVVQNLGNNLYDFYDALGQFNITGNVISSNGANLTFVKNAGSVFTRSFNFATNHKNPNVVSIPASSTPASFAYRTQTGGTTPNITLIDPTSYDVNGVVTPVPGAGGTTTIQRVFLFPSGNIRIQYGQNTYNSLVNAINGLSTDEFVLSPSLQGLSILIGYIVVQKNCTDLTSNRARIIKAARFDSGTDGGSISTTTLQGAYNNSVSPEIITDSTRGAFTLQVGSGSDSNTVLELLNTTGGTVSYITGQGNSLFNNITGNTFIKNGGLSTQFLKADGSLDSNTYLTNNQSITFTSSGDITGSTTGAVSLLPTLNLATINQTSTGSFIKVSLDNKGRVTGNTAVLSSDIISALGYTPSSGSSTYVGTSNRITVTGNVIDIASNYIGQSTIDTLGTITGGTWNGTVISATAGGTGTGTYTTGQILFASATNTLSKLNIGSTGQLLSVVAGVPAWVSTSGLTISNTIAVEFGYKYTVASSLPFYRAMADTGPTKYVVTKNCTIESVSYVWGVAPSGATYRFWYSINGGTWTLVNTSTIASGTAEGQLTPTTPINLSSGNTIQFYYVTAGLSGTSLSFNVIFKS